MMTRRSIVGSMLPVFLTAATTPAPVAAVAQAGPRHIDAAALRAAGAKFDGRTDDGPAIQAAIDGASLPDTPRTGVVLELPAGIIRIGAPVRSGRHDLVLRGAGREVTILLMERGAGGAWCHGSPTEPAHGTLTVEAISLVDEAAPSPGATALTVRFASDVPDECLFMHSIAFKGWHRALYVIDAPRGWRCDSIEVVGPDDVMQPDAGIIVESTGMARLGCFDYLFSDVMVSNYRWGWRYKIAATLEGQVFRNCHAYNGHGLLSADCTVPNYRSLLWVFDDCDAEGAAPLLDLKGCRDVTIRGGFFITSHQKAVPPDQDSTTALLRLRDCADVLADHVEFDATPDSAAGLAVVYCDGSCRRIRFRDTTITALVPFRAGFQWARNPSANTIAELDTVWAHWTAGPMLLDEGSNQVAQSIVRGARIGDVTASGFYTLHGRSTGTRSDHGDVTVPLPRRPDGAPFFLDGPPAITFATEGSGGGRFMLGDVAADHFVLRPINLSAAAGTVDWSASGS